MSATILEGAPLAQTILDAVRDGVAELKRNGIVPTLAALQVGPGSPAIRGYLKSQVRSADACGVVHTVREVPEDITEAGLGDVMAELNADPAVHGVLLLVPLPPHLDARRVQGLISPSKDVEGMHPENLGRLFYGDQTVAPCTAAAAVELLLSTGIDLAGKEVVVVGHSEIVGKPVAMLLLQSPDAAPTVTVCHVATARAGRTADHVSRADVVISAVGVKPGLISADMLKPGATVIDVATLRVPLLDGEGAPILNAKGKPKKTWVGDVDFDGARARCAAITPVPGGVGPVTASILMRNLLYSAQAAR